MKAIRDSNGISEDQQKGSILELFGNDNATYAEPIDCTIIYKSSSGYEIIEVSNERYIKKKCSYHLRICMG